MIREVPEIKAEYSHSKMGTLMFNLCANWTKFILAHRWLYYLTAFTWGALMTFIGVIVSGVLYLVKLVAPNKVKIKFNPYYWMYSISVGPDYWGGCSLGLCFIRDHKSNSSSLSAHEFGHTFQNCLLGPLFPFIVALPSAAWYWTHTLSKRKLKPYDSMWFEDAATQCGLYAIRTINRKRVT